MAERMSHRPWYFADTYVDPAGPLALGRIGSGVFNREAQPYRSADGGRVVFFSGILFDRPASVASDAELIDILYRAHGYGFARHLKGEFIALIWDRARQDLLLTNDRFGF